MKPCIYCDGSGEDVIAGLDCPFCHGTGEVTGREDPDDRDGPEWEAD